MGISCVNKKMKQQNEYIAAKIAADCLSDMHLPASIKDTDIRAFITQNRPNYNEQDINECVMGCVVFKNYLKTRQAYLFHPLLVHELTQTTNLNFYMTDLHLPYNTLYIDLASAHIRVDNREIQGVYIHNIPEEKSCAIIALVKINQEQVILMYAAMDYSEQKTLNELAKTINGNYKNEDYLYHAIFSLLTYISSDEPDVVNAGKKIAFRYEKNHRKVPSVTNQWNVGYRYVQFYKQKLGHIPTIEELKESNKPVSHHHTPRKHLRAAHWHTYLYGPKKSLRKIIWVQACWVGNGDNIDTIHVEKEHNNY